MSGSGPNMEEAITTQRRAVRWDAVAAIIASLVGLLALLVAGYTAYVQRQQVRAQVWPRLLLGSSDVMGQYELTALNQGVGPAIVDSVQVLVAGKSVSDWHALAKSFGFKPASPWVAGTLNNMVLTPGEHLHWIQFQNAADIKEFKNDWLRFNVEARVCYSSTLGESWLVVFHPGELTTPQEVSGCPKLPAKDRFND
jgi:hypothetical protein